MTTDEAIKYITDFEKNLYDACVTKETIANDELMRTLEAFNFAIKELKHDRWISCSERLPEPNHYVLIKKTDGDFTIGEYLGTEFPIQDAWFFANGEYNGRTKDIKEWKELE